MSSTESLSDEESLPPCNGTAGKYGYLVVDDEWHEIAVGETKIGRDASICSIVMREATLSMLHAVIESEGPEDSFIYDANSSNKTKIGKMKLKPFCRYRISDNDTIKMGNKIFQYKVVDHEIKNCKTESSSNIFKLCMSDEKENVTVTQKNKTNVLDENVVLKVKDQGNNFHVSKISLSAPEKVSNKPLQPYYILASELFNTDIFSQATQCEIKSESFKARNTEIVDSNDDIHNAETQCGPFDGIDEAESELKFDKGSSENIHKIRESCFNDSATFDLVRKNENKYLLSSSFCKSISDDIFELPTQPQLEIHDSQKVLVDKDQNFRNCFSSNLFLFNSDKSEKDHASGNQVESDTNLCKRETENLNCRDVDPEFFDDDRDEELCELMRAVSPGINDNNDYILSHREKLSDNNRVKESNVPDECCEIQNPSEFGLSNSENSNQSENESFLLECDANERSELVQTNTGRKELTNSEHALRSSVKTCSLVSQKVKKCNIKGSPERELTEGEGDSVNKKGENSDGNILKIAHEDKKVYNQETRNNSGGNPSARKHPLNCDNECDGSQNACQEDQCIRRESVSPNGVVSELMNDEYKSDSGVRLRRQDFKETVKEIKSPLINETLNEVWEKQSKWSPASSNKTVSDLDISEFQGNYVTTLESDSEEDFISTQGLCSLNKSNGEKPGVKKTRSKLDVWKENWQDFIFTQHLSNENCEESESESTDKTESDIVVSTGPIPDVGHSEINETPGREGVFDIDDNSNESECLIKEKIEVESSPDRVVCLAEDDFDEVICESPVLLQPNIQTDNFQDGEQKIPIKSAGESVIKEYEPNRNGVVSDSDETDCEDERKAMEPVLSRNRGEEVFPSTSDLKENIYRESKQIANDLNISSEKRDCSPLKRMLRSDKDVILPKKRSKSIRKKKESGDVGGRQLRSRGVKVSGERYKPEGGKSKYEVKVSCRKRIVNNDVASAKELDFVLEKSLSECVGSESAYSESRWQPSSMKIVFTGFESESHNRIISRLGGLRVNDFKEGNVLVTDKVRRTVKFLSAVALGLPIVSTKWLISSNKESKFLDPWHYLLEDDAAEERWGFNLRTSLEKWRKEKLLEGFNVFATKNTKPPVPEILSIVECCGGISFASYPEVWPEKSIVLTCLEDKKSWPHYRFRNVKIVHYEFLLSGVLKHAMDFKTYKLR